jgi:hypothetical protein
VAISRASDSSIQGGLPKFNDIWDGRSAVGGMDALGVVLLASETADITFNNIPQTYTHLQVRYFTKSVYSSGTTDSMYFRANGDSSGAYSAHFLRGNGSAGSSGDAGVSTYGWTGNQANSGTGMTSIYGSGTLDILDYSNTNKYKTFKFFGGYDANGSGVVILSSSNWRSTTGITSLTFGFTNGNHAVGSTMALYGIK